MLLGAIGIALMWPMRETNGSVIPMPDARMPRPAYYLGHSDRELDRLRAQARVIDPITRRFFRDAGIIAGMRVLDVGSGAGDVALLVADLVGESGEVVGVDRAPIALAKATARAGAQSRRNVFFREGDPAQMSFDRPFDAIVGRYVLQFQPDPAAMLRKLAVHVKLGGLDRVPRNRLGRRPLISVIANIRAVLPMDP